MDFLMIFEAVTLDEADCDMLAADLVKIVGMIERAAGAVAGDCGVPDSLEGRRQIAVLEGDSADAEADVVRVRHEIEFRMNEGRALIMQSGNFKDGALSVPRVVI